MKMLFRNGRIREDATGIGLEKIDFISNDSAVMDFFNHSLWQIKGLLGGYEVELYKRINGQEVFYLYDQRMDEQQIIDELDTIFQKDSVENVVNYEETMIKEAVEDTDLNKTMGIKNGHQVLVRETIFWDVLNHFIVIIGKAELFRFGRALEEEKNKDYLSVFPGSTIGDLISSEAMSKYTK